LHHVTAPTCTPPATPDDDEECELDIDELTKEIDAVFDEAEDVEDKDNGPVLCRF
jgi:hypothetical protein